MNVYVFLMFLVLSALTITAKSDQHVSPRIIGGQPARAGQFRFAAAIYVQTATGRFFCGGALTGTTWIVTSGYCVYNAEHFTIQLGSTMLEGADENRQTFATSTYYLHPDFDPETLDNDIAVIELRLPAMMSGYIQPIYASGSNVVNSTIAITLGFGQLSDSEGELSNELYYAEISTLTNEECRLFYGNQITDNHICAIGNYNEGTCIGDTGGPLIITSGKFSLVIGVASFISGNGCESTEPSGYTRIYPYRDWLHNITGRYDN